MAKAEQTVRHPIFARCYQRFSVEADRRGGADHRAELLQGLAGRVVEVGAGNGRNFAHYPDAVTEVVAIEPEPSLRTAALNAAQRTSVPIRMVDGVADRLDLEDGSCDAGVASLVLCTVPDQERALGELHRVIRPGGELRFYEHVVSRRPLAATVERALDATFYPPLAGGCHLARDTVGAVESAGFEITTCRRFGFAPSALAPQIAHVIGVARRP
jgi:ubiquinone/menaquinone biosynthesis C-methylase UbiE